MRIWTFLLRLFLIASAMALSNGQTLAPTANPTATPTTTPTTAPTQAPTTTPTTTPTLSPNTPEPTINPTTTPTASPTKTPTTTPTASPTKTPTQGPTLSPNTPEPTINPTTTPTASPTKTPTQSPTSSPTTPEPTTSPTQNPTNSPTTSPTESPTNNPTVTPTQNPTTSPTVSPTKNPTTTPTVSPTFNPTASPVTNQPTISPTPEPTNNPTTTPTQSPTNNPTNTPTESPTDSPTVSPINNPTLSPVTPNPTRNPTIFVPAAGGSGAGAVIGGISAFLVISILLVLAAFRAGLIGGKPGPSDDISDQSKKELNARALVHSTSDGTEGSRTKSDKKAADSSLSVDKGVGLAAYEAGLKADHALIKQGQVINVDLLTASSKQAKEKVVKKKRKELGRRSAPKSPKPFKPTHMSIMDKRRSDNPNFKDASDLDVLTSKGKPNKSAPKATDDDDDEANFALFEQLITKGKEDGAKQKSDKKKNLSPAQKSDKNGIKGKSVTLNPSFGKGKPDQGYIAEQAAKEEERRSIFAPSNQFIERAAAKQSVGARPDSQYLEEAELKKGHKSIFRPSSLFLSQAQKNREMKKTGKKKNDDDDEDLAEDDI